MEQQPHVYRQPSEEGPDSLTHSVPELGQNQHSDQGVADLRGRPASERCRCVVFQCRLSLTDKIKRAA